MTFSTLVVALSILGAAWSDLSHERIQSKAPWLEVPRPEDVVPEEFPWQVAVIADDMVFCGGSLVAKKWIMTAAHCTSDVKVFDVAIGSLQGVRQTTRSATRHPEYIPDSQEKDLALLELAEEVQLSKTVGTARLPAPGFSEGITLTLTGWATLQDKLSIWAGVSPPPLKAIQVSIAPDNVCTETYGDSFSSNKICLDTTASPHDEGFLALADGGLPLVSLESDGKYTQIGVLSFGPGSSNLRRPVVATKVLPLLPWIQKVTGISPE